jgi:rsbT co-antagonist protein RsbR
MTNQSAPINSAASADATDQPTPSRRQEALLDRILSIWFVTTIPTTLALIGAVLASGLAYQYIVLLALVGALSGALYWGKASIGRNSARLSISSILALLLLIALAVAMFFVNGFYAICAVSFMSILMVTLINRTTGILLISMSTLVLFLLFAILQQQGVLKPLQMPANGWLELVVPLMVSVSIPVSGLLMLLISKNLGQSLSEAEERGRLAEEARAAQAVTLARVEQQAAEQARLIELVHDLEIPVIPLLEGVLVLPIVGHLDSRRMRHLTQTLLERVAADRAHTVLLDLTAISLLDTDTANHLLKLTSGVRLLGARCILSGIRADVAHTLVSLGISWANIQTVASLRDGMAYLHERQHAQDDVSR